MLFACRSLFVVLTLAALGGCRQAEGPLPIPDDEDRSRIEDLANNLQNIARGDPEGEPDLIDDLTLFVRDDAEAVAVVTAFAGSLGTAVDGRPLEKEPSLALGHQAWLLLNAREISESQVEQLQAGMRDALAGAGVDEPRAGPVLAQMVDVQRLITERPRRWYQLF